MTKACSRTEQDAARLQEIRAWANGESSSGVGSADIPFLLSLLDARPHDAEFVTKAKHDAALAELAGWRGCWQERKVRAEIAEAERDRLATALAASEARCVELQRTLARSVPHPPILPDPLFTKVTR